MYALAEAVIIQQGFGDTNIGQRIIGDLYSKNFTLSIGNSKYRYANKVQTAHSLNQTKSFIVLCCLHFSIFVLKFVLFRDSISFVYSCFINPCYTITGLKPINVHCPYIHPLSPHLFLRILVSTSLLLNFIKILNKINSLREKLSNYSNFNYLKREIYKF